MWDGSSLNRISEILAEERQLVPRAAVGGQSSIYFAWILASRRGIQSLLAGGSGQSHWGSGRNNSEEHVAMNARKTSNFYKSHCL